MSDCREPKPVTAGVSAPAVALPSHTFQSTFTIVFITQHIQANRGFPVFSHLDRRSFVRTGLAVTGLGLLPAKAGGDALAAQPSNGRLTFHAIDNYLGQTMEGLSLSLVGGSTELRRELILPAGGRPEIPLIAEGELVADEYEMALDVDSYFARHADPRPPGFLTRIILRFGIADASQPHHLVLLFSPWGYSYYRGS